MKLEIIMQLLMRGATIQKGAFSGYWLCARGGKRTRLTSQQEKKLLPKCKRIDEGKSRNGAEWAFCDCQRPPTHISNGCLIHNDYPRFDDETPTT